MMDVSGNFHGEDYNKQDFLDFMIAPGLTEQNLTSSDFGSKQLKSLGLFYDNFETLSERKDIKVEPDNSAKENAVADGTEKETNNNHLLMSSDPSINYSSYWNNKDEMMKWDTTMLVDEISSWSSPIGEVQDRSTENNTDGSIYTLTVLNNPTPNSLLTDNTTKTMVHHGTDGASWFREPPETVHNINVQPNEKVEGQSLASAENNDMLVIESLFNIIPSVSDSSQSMDVPTRDNLIDKKSKISSSSNESFEPLKLNKSTNENHSILNEDENYFMRNNSSNVNKIILEMNLAENNEEQQKKQSNQTSSIKTEWIDLTDNNISSDIINNSLLRNALQGKSLIRYNGGTEKNEKPNEYSAKHLHSTINSSNDRSANNNNNTNCLNQFNVDENRVVKIEDSQMGTMSPTTSEHRTILLYNNNLPPYEDGRLSRLTVLDSGSESTNVDDIFLSHLDNSMAFPEDYEKLKSIENEVAESVSLNSTCYFNNGSNNDPTSNSSNYMHPAMISSNSLLNPLFQHNQVPTLEIASTTCNVISNNYHNPNSGTNVQKSRKYKRQQSSNKNNNSNSAAVNSVKSSNVANTSTGLRKERSLHYCNICNKGFKDKYSVNVHIRTHTGEKPFSCTLCGKSFRQKAHLAKHYHTHLTGQSKTSHSSSSSSNNTSKNS